MTTKKGCLTGCLAAVGLVFLLFIVMAVCLRGSDDQSSPSLSDVIDNQQADYQRLFDKYLACQGKKWSRELENDMNLLGEVMRDYQRNPTRVNRNQYLAVRKGVEVKLAGC